MVYRNKILAAVLIAAIVVGGGWIWSQKDRCGMKYTDASYNPYYCDASCNVDIDCVYHCGCGAINKYESCISDEMCGINHEVKCDTGKCVIYDKSILEKISELSEQKALSIVMQKVKQKCESENPEYVYDYNQTKKIDGGWRIPISNLNCPCFTTVNAHTEEVSCMKQIPFKSESDKFICGPKAMGLSYDGSYCDRSCNADSDCQYSCGCGAINRNEVCNHEGIKYDCTYHTVSCESGKCVLGQESIPSVTIETDKTEYMQGETIYIAVKNGLNVPILYYGGERLWGIEYFENNTWKNRDYEKGGGFQLAGGNINDSCYIRLYERMPPDKMDANNTISLTWNQKICPYGEGDPSEANFVSYIGRGRYRLMFYYGFGASSNDSFKIANIITVYSNEFTIKFAGEEELPSLVSITTDKAEYNSGENVNLMIKNNQGKTEFVDFPAIDHLEDNQWTPIRIQWAGCGVPGGMLYLPLDPYGTMTYAWDQKEKWCTGKDPWDMNMSSQEALPGKYRVKSRIIARTKNETDDPNNIFGKPTDKWLYSDEFTIK